MVAEHTGVNEGILVGWSWGGDLAIQGWAEPEVLVKGTDFVVNEAGFLMEISLRINSREPKKVFEYTDSFIRDILFEINSKDIFLDWEKYKSENKLSEEVM